MLCHEALAHIEDLLDGQLAAPRREAVELHLARCTECRSALDREERLRRALREAEVPEPAPGLEDRVLTEAMRRGAPGHRSPAWPAAAAAALAAAFGLGVLTANGPERMPATAPDARPPTAQSVALTPGSRKEIHLVFESARAMRDVTMTLRLPAQTELVGHPGRRTLTWRTDLERGRNRLTVPLVAHGGAGGELRAEIADGNARGDFTVQVNVSQAEGSTDDTSQRGTVL